VSSIEWTGPTWNPTTGCDKVSKGCDICYALTMAGRLQAMGQPAYQNDGDPRTSGPGFALTMHPDRLDMPFKWRKPGPVFVNSMSDLFHPKVTVEFIAQVVARMVLTPHLQYQVLTKRAPRMYHLMKDPAFWNQVADHVDDLWTQGRGRALPEEFATGPWWPLPNLWLGTSVEDPEQAERRIPYLMRTPGKRFLSMEPLLERVVLDPYVSAGDARLDWVIVGGESGRGARPLDPEWVSEIAGYCEGQGVAFFMKQMGSVWARANRSRNKGGNPEDWPVRWPREFPPGMVTAPVGAR
jgi:protein gp37